MRIEIKPDQHAARPSRGQSLVEFALAITIIMFLLLAAIDFGLAFLSWITLRDAALEGSNYGSIAPPVSANAISAIQDRIRSSATAPVNLNTLNPTNDILMAQSSDGISWVNCSGTSCAATACPGNAIRVTVNYNYHMISPMVSNFIGTNGNIPISASVTNTILVAGNAVVCP